MKRTLKSIIHEMTTNLENENRLSREEIFMFKQLNRRRSDFKTQKELMNFIDTLIFALGLDEKNTRFYYEIYIQNYRPEGDYENLTYQNVKNLKPKRVSNINSSEYVSSKLPFIGSNLKGYWGFNNKNQSYYVVKSYGWYPIFLFINNKWYEVSDRYSSSTGKQISHSRPYRYSSEVDDRIYSVTRDEMDKLIRGIDLSEIEKDRVKNFVEKFKTDYGKTGKTITIGYGNDRKRVTFNIDRVSKLRDKVKVLVSILKAGPVVNNKMVVNPEGYMSDLEFVDDIEMEIKNRVIRDNSDYLTPENTVFEFKHSN